MLCAPLAAQQVDYKPAPLPDPVKGMHEISALTPAELARRAGRESPAGGGVPQQVQRPADLFPRVLFDQPGDGRIWARGATYKASFDTEGFTYVPDFGAAAPQNYPVQLVLRAVRLGGRDVAFAAMAQPVRTGDRVTFDRGVVREVYDLTPEHVEQSFVVDVSPGDLEVEIEVRSELREDAERPGLQFGNALGLVHYGTAFVVDGASKREIASTFAGSTIRLQVAAAQRGPGAVVIDPIIHSSAFTHVSNRDCHNPDIAYDATFDRYMVVWEHFFSATDTDIFSEFRNGDGTTIAGSLASIDFTILTHAHPRVANLNAFDRFLVVMQRFEAGRWQIWGRLRAADSTPHPIVFPISDPGILGHCINPDIGGDSGAGDHWLVVWQRELSAVDFDIHARMVRGDIALQPATIFIENTANTIYSLPHVSQSNGNGTSSDPHWLVVYQFRFSATDEDIYGAALSSSGAITRTSTGIDTSSFVDLVPSVASPATDFSGGAPMYMVTYERQSPLEGRVRILSRSLVNQITPASLAPFGCGPFWVRAESDGCRFAVISGAATISVATLAMANGALVLHDAPQALNGVPAYPRIAAKRSGGGIANDYGIAFVDTAPAPDQIWVAAYLGVAGGGAINRRSTACGGLGIDVAGRVYLGAQLQFTLANTGADLTGHVLGLPAPALALCFGCSFGLDLNGPLINVPGGQMTLPIGCNSSLVGVTLAVQGYAFGSGTCLGSGRFSDTIDFTIS